MYKALSLAEQKQFERFLHSPYFNVPPTALAFFTYLGEIHRAMPEKYFTPSTLARQVPLLKTVAIQDTAGSQLMKAYDKFCELRQWQQNSSETTYNRLLLLKTQNRHEEFKTEYDNFEKELHSRADKDAVYFDLLQRLTELKFNRLKPQPNAKKREDIKPVIDAIDTHYAILKIRYLCEAFNRQRVLDTQWSAQELNPLLPHLQAYQTEQYAYVWLFTQACHMLSAGTYAESLPYYSLIKEYIAKQPANTTSSTVIELSDYMQSHSVRWSSAGFAEAAKEYLYWIEYKMNHQLLAADGQIAPVVFTNALTTMIRIKHPLHKIQQFVRKYEPMLPPEMINGSRGYADGLIAFASAHFDAAARHFTAATSPPDRLFNCILKRWIFMSKFEQAPYNDHLHALLTNFEKYIARNKAFLPTTAPAFLQFIHYARLLLTHTGKNEKQQVITALTAQAYFSGKDWLLEKLTQTSNQ